MDEKQIKPIEILPIEEKEYFYIGIGCDTNHIDNIYRCMNKEDANFLEKKLKTDIEQLEKWIKNHPKAEKTEIAKTKLQIEWLKKLKFWHISGIILKGEYKNE